MSEAVKDVEVQTTEEVKEAKEAEARAEAAIKEALGIS